MFPKIFKRGSSNNSNYIKNDLGEWLLVSRNPEISFIDWSVRKTIKKLGCKKFDFYILQYDKDNNIKNFISNKVMIISKQNLRESDIIQGLNKTLENFALIGETKISKLKICGDVYLFLYFDIILKKIKNYHTSVKVLLPPLGIKTSNIPYTPEDLFKDILNNAMNTSCTTEFEVQEGKYARILADCENISQYDNLKYVIPYFIDAGEMKISIKKSELTKSEIQLDIFGFKSKSLIPLVWDNFMSTYAQC
uniref:Uncharacterized protein n=1 Tax=Acidianus brierleyi TaxID=41673 RepID=A0A2U9IG11_9CREN